MKRLRYIVLSIVFGLGILTSQAQSNPEFISDKILFTDTKSYIFTSEFPGLLFHELVTDLEDGEDAGTWGIYPQGNKAYEFRFTATDTPAELEFILKYFISVPNSNLPRARYIQLKLLSVPSIVDANRDYVLDADGTNSVSALNNDISSVDELEIYEIVKQQDVLATKNGDDIDLSSLTGDRKMYAQYVAKDSVSTTDLGTVVIVPETNPELNLEQNLYTTNKSNLNFTLPSGGYTYDPDFGSLNGTLTELESFAFQYAADQNFVGTDILRFNHFNGSHYTINLSVYDKSINNGFLRNDLVYVARNETVAFNVQQNDLELLNIINSSADDVDGLNYMGAGLFTYTAPENYTGIQNFEYSCLYLGEVQTAEIKIVVNDQEPYYFDTYNFETKANTPYVIEYQVPISTNSWYVAQEPTNGTLSILGENDILSGACYEVEGVNKIVYTPNADFTGNDHFEIAYEPTSGLSYIMDTDVNVSTSDSDCHCVDDCVWKGDVDNDGKVDLLDLFALGNHFGETTDPRTDDSEDWIGLSSDGNTDARYADINGDGVVSEEDADDFFDYYGNSHSYYRPSDLISSEYSIEFIPQVSEIDSGELLRIDVVLGNDDFPAIEVNGLSFALNINSAFADSASMNVIYEYNSWFCHNDPTIALTHVPEDGRIETAVANTANTSGSGQGIIAVVEFIVEEDGDGFRESADGFKTLAVEIDDIYVAGVDGEHFKLAPQIIEIPYGKQNEDLSSTEFDNEDLIVYPNPSKESFNLFLNGPERIHEIQLFSANGTQIMNTTSLDTDAHNISLTGLPDGVYFLQIISENHAYTKKLQLLK